MKITAKREIFIERTRTLTIRFASAPVSKFCGKCQTESRFVTINEAAIIAQMTAREIFRRIESDRLHDAETAEGFLLVCLVSLQNFTAVNMNQLTTKEK